MYRILDLEHQKALHQRYKYLASVNIACRRLNKVAGHKRYVSDVEIQGC